MALNPVDYNGGGDVVLGSFFSGISNAYNRNQARIAKEQQAAAELAAKQQKELSDIVKKVNTTGVQKQDIGDMNQKLNSIYDTYYKANKASSREERLSLRMDLERQLSEMGNFVYSSKQRGVEQVKLADYQAKNPGLFAPEATAKFKQLSEQPTAKLEPNAFSTDKFISPDTGYLNTIIENSAKSLLGNANVSRRLGERERVGNQMSTQQFEEKAVGKEMFGTDLTAKYNQDVKFKNLVDYTAGQIGVTPQQYILGVVDEYDKASKLKQTKQLAPIMDARPRAAKSGSGSSAGEGDVIAINIPYADGKASVPFDEYVPLSIPDKNFAGSTSIDLTTGKINTEPLPSSGKYEVVGIGNAPIMKGRKDKNLNGAIAQPDFVRAGTPGKDYDRKAIVHVKDQEGIDYFIPLDRLPANVKNSKSILSAMAKFKPATATTRTTTTPSTRSSTPKATGKKTIKGF